MGGYSASSSSSELATRRGFEPPSGSAQFASTPENAATDRSLGIQTTVRCNSVLRPDSEPHIRQPWHRTFRVTSSGYVKRGKNQPEPKTYCGAPVTAYDYTSDQWKRATKQRATWPCCFACAAVAL